jgi:hypothetical protein
MEPNDRPPLPADVDEFVQENGRTFMMTRRKDGMPTAHPMARFYAEGRVFLNMYSKSLKHHILERDPKITCLITNRGDAPDFKAVVYRGKARRVSIAETLADDAPLGIRIARTGSMEAAIEADGDLTRFAGEDHEDLRKRAKVMIQRIASETRVLWEVVPDQTEFLDRAREE